MMLRMNVRVTCSNFGELRELLSPKITLKKPVHWGAGEESTDEPGRIRQLVDWELEPVFS
jgi:hypothetical protein